jgi:hypothetical protein
MPLPASGPREELHIRQIEMRGYRREDGMFEIEGRVNDRKTYSFRPPSIDRTIEAGEFIHDMWVRLVIDTDMVVQDVFAVSDKTPMAVCKQAAPTLGKMIGVRIAGGWTKEVKRRLGRSISCTHLMELLIPLGTAAFQTLSPVRHARPDPLDAEGRPTKIDTCFAYDSGREAVLRRWPAFYTGPSGEELERRIIPVISAS